MYSTSYIYGNYATLPCLLHLLCHGLIHSCNLPMHSHSPCSAPGVQPIVTNISSLSPRSITITVKPASQYEQVNGEFRGYVVQYRAAGSQVNIQLGRVGHYKANSTEVNVPLPRH